MDTNTPSPDGGRPVRLTATAAARHLGIDRSTLYRWVKRGTVPEHRAPSGRPWYDPAELDAAMDGGGEPGNEKGTPGEGPLEAEQVARGSFGGERS